MNNIYDPYIERLEFLKFGNITNTDLLDIGAGSGQLGYIAVTKMGCQVICIDPSLEALERAKMLLKKEDLHGRLRYEQQDARALSYANNSFTCVACYSVLHHVKVEAREKVIFEASRVAREKVLFSELTTEGAKYFDEVLHPDEKHQDKLVNSDWLLSKLSPSKKITFFFRKFTYFVMFEKFDPVSLPREGY